MRTGAISWLLVAGCGRIDFAPAAVDATDDLLPNVHYLYRNDDGSGVHGLDALLTSDLSFGDGTIDYRDTSHVQGGHAYDLHIPPTTGWSPIHDPAAPSEPADTSAYTYLIFDLWTANPGDAFDSSWSYNYDVFAPAYVDDVKTVPGVGPLVDGDWTKRIEVPLAYYGYLGMKGFFRFSLRDNAHMGGDSYWDNVGLVPGDSTWIYDGGAPTAWDAMTRMWTAHDNVAPVGGWSDASENATANYAFDPTTLSQLTQATSLNGLTDPALTQQVTNVIELSVTTPGGAWKVTHPGFTLAPYTTLTFGLLATAATHGYRVQLYDTGGAAIGSAIDPTAYTNHDWGASDFFSVYCIPLTAFGTLPAQIGGISIQDTSGQATNTIYLSAVGFFS